MLTIEYFLCRFSLNPFVSDCSSQHWPSIQGADFILIIRPTVIILGFAQQIILIVASWLFLLWENSGATRVSGRRTERRSWRQLLSQKYWNYAQRKNSSEELSRERWQSYSCTPRLCWNFRTKISGSDPQIYPGTFQLLWIFVTCFSKLFRQLLIWKPGMKPRSNRLNKTTSQINHTGMRLDSHIITGNENLYIYFLGKVIHGNENNVCLWRTTTVRHYYHLPFWFLHVRLLCFVLLYYKHDILSCPFVKVFSMTLAQSLTAISLMCNCVVPSDDSTSFGLSLHSLIILTGYVSIDLGLKESYIFLCVLGCVFPRFPVTTRVTHTEHFHIHTHNTCRLSHHHTKLRDHFW